MGNTQTKHGNAGGGGGMPDFAEQIRHLLTLSTSAFDGPLAILKELFKMIFGTKIDADGKAVMTEEDRMICDQILAQGKIFARSHQNKEVEREISKVAKGCTLDRIGSMLWTILTGAANLIIGLILFAFSLWYMIMAHVIDWAIKTIQTLWDKACYAICDWWSSLGVKAIDRLQSDVAKLHMA